MNKDWMKSIYTISPVWDNGNQRYEISVEDVVQKMKDMGYYLEDASEYSLYEKVDSNKELTEKVKELEKTIEELTTKIQELESKLQ